MPRNNGTPNDNNSKKNKSKIKITSKFKKNSENEISKSKQLQRAFQNKRPVVRKVSTRRTSPRLCANVKPMPSLEDLEKMFEDSDTDTESQTIQNEPIQANIEFLTNDVSSTESFICDTESVGHNKTSENSNPHFNSSKSVFNDQFVQIAKNLKSENSTSNANEVDSPVLPERPRFSPIPSTSKDRNVFLQNHRHLEETSVNNGACDESQSDVVMVERDCETIIIDDEPQNSQSELLQVPNNLQELGSPIVIDDDEDLIEPVVDSNTYNFNSSIVVDDFDSLDINIELNIDHTENDCEIIDVDDVIAQNSTILQKYSRKKTLNIVTNVEPNQVIESNQPTVINLNNEGKDTLSVSSNNNSIRFAVDFFGNNPTNIENSTSNNNAQVNQSNTTDGIQQNNDTTNNNENTIRSVVDNFFGSNQSSVSQVRQTNTNESSLIEIAEHCAQSLSRCYELAINEIRQVNNTINLSLPLNQSETMPSRPSITVTNGLSVTNETRRVNNFQTDIHISSFPLSNGQRSVTPMDRTDAEQDNTGRGIGSCPICIEPFSGQDVAATMCGHVFCKLCIEASLKVTGKKCPTCRKALKGKSYHQLFI